MADEAINQYLKVVEPGEGGPTGGTYTFTVHDGKGHSGTSDPVAYNADASEAAAAFKQAIERARDSDG